MAEINPAEVSADFQMEVTGVVFGHRQEELMNAHGTPREDCAACT